MKKYLLILSILLASGVVSGARSLTPEALGTFNYEVRYKLGAITTKVGTATISLEKGEWDDQPAYYSKASIKASSIFRLFLGADNFAESWLDRKSLAPLHYSNPFTKKGFKGMLEYDFDADSRTIESTIIKSAQDTVRATFPLDGRTLDLLALMHDVRVRDFSPSGDPVQIHVLLAGQSVAATLSYVELDEEMFPDQEADHILLKLIDRGLMENGSGNEIHLWRSRESDCRLLRLEAVLSSGTMLVTIQD